MVKDGRGSTLERTAIEPVIHLMSRGAPTAPFQSARWPLVLQWMPRVNPMRLLIMAIGLYTTCYCFVNENRVCFLVMFEDSNIRFSNPASCCLDDRWRSYSWLLKAATPGRRWPTCYRRSRGAYHAQRERIGCSSLREGGSELGTI